MAINKRKYLGKSPDELGVKDAIHVAIVSCVAGCAIKCGARVQLNRDGHAEECGDQERGGFGVADPFAGQIARGQKFWVMLDPDSVDTVSHSWDHKIEFPTNPVPVPQNRCLVDFAAALGVSYTDLMAACAYYVKTGHKHGYPGTLSQETAEEQAEKHYLSDMWSEWSDESGYEFDNDGSECCPECSYPDEIPFQWM